MKVNLMAEYELDRCYSIAPLTWQGKKHILVAAEKVNKCILFDTKGNPEDVIWEAPGGTMSMIQVPGSDGWFLATHEFYSPNDGAKAHIVLVRPVDGKWVIQTIKDLPFCHRFSVVTRGGVNYLIGCTIKSKHKYKNDWRFPGAIWVGELPSDLENYNEDHQVPMTCIKDGLLKNHGYFTIHTEEGDYSLVGTENGVFRVTPPDTKGGDWKVEQLTAEPASDMALADFDGDGQDEMITIAPFHGDSIAVYKKDADGDYDKVWDCPFKMEFSHSIWARSFYGQEKAIIGARKGGRDLVEFYYENGEYKTNILAHDVGSANIYPFDREDGGITLVSTNREINQIAFYDLVK
ncbi:MAG: hypothetical protein VZR02_01295 [Lachnospiraceae bacterium]|nr:hypothetical protein [Lachnospiraceae bacterium]